MKVNFVSSSSSGSLSQISAQTLVAFSSQKENETQVHPKALAKEVQSSVDDKSITGKHLECLFFREKNLGQTKHLLVVGLGMHKAFKDDTASEFFRSVGASIHDQLKAAKVKEAAIALDELPFTLSPIALRALVEGLWLASYSFDELKTKTKGKPAAATKKASAASAKGDEEATELLIHLLSKEAAKAPLKKAFQDAVTLGETVNFSRRLGDLPGNLMTPAIMADEVVKAAKGSKLKVTVWDGARIRKERMGGLAGVARGSSEEPRFIIMEYKGGGKSEKPLVYVGKGLTFDTGGISIKPSAGMEEMKYDMCGGANVIGALLAISRLGLKVNAIGLVAASENMPSGNATKPGDVHYARNGKSFEVNNTDAEGRLILADALCYATELEPKAILDAATLTGAMVVALGNSHTGYFTRDKKLRDTIEKAAGLSGEWVWNMPLCDHHTKDMKGTYADLSNTSSFKGAGSATAAAFLEQFVGEGIPWAHFDIAGTAWHVGNRLNYCPRKGASGAMIRTFVEFARLHE